MIQRYNADRDFDLLLAKGQGGTTARPVEYGRVRGLKPLGDYPDKLVNPNDYKEVIQDCHDEQIFPIHHQHDTWAPPGFRWNQNGLPYCWAWGVTAALMDQRAREGKETVELAPVSLGWLVNWQNRGNYLSDAIRGATERGVCSRAFVPDQHNNNPRTFRSGWEEDALKYRINSEDVWDLDNSSRTRMIQHCISAFRTGTGVYIAYNWWGHALEAVGVEWDEREPYNLVWKIRNSHNEDNVIELTGNKAVPDEAFGIGATLTV